MYLTLTESVKLCKGARTLLPPFSKSSPTSLYYIIATSCVCPGWLVVEWSGCGCVGGCSVRSQGFCGEFHKQTVTQEPRIEIVFFLVLPLGTVGFYKRSALMCGDSLPAGLLESLPWQSR